MKWNRSDWLILILLALLVLLFHWRLLTPNLADRYSYPPGDFTAQFWAFSTLEARELSAGHLPLWNPYTYAGSPFWADVQSAVLYPFSLLTLLLSGALGGGFSLFALQLEAIFHFWLAGIFMYLFARRITQSRPAGFTAAIAFAFGGYLTGYPSQQLAVLEVDVWLPLILFFIDRAILERQPGQSAARRNSVRWRDLLVAGGAWGMAILAGHPQSWMITGYTFAAYLLFAALWKRTLTRQSITAAIVALVAVAITGAALAAIQLLPAVEYTRLSVRAEGLYDKMAGGFPLTDTLQLLLPGVVSQYSPLYVGAIGLLLAIVALVYHRTRFSAFWGVWGGASLLIAFGGNTFLYSPLYLAGPGFSIFRGQERWAFAVAFSLAVLIGYGAKAVIANRRAVDGLARLTGWLSLGALALSLAFFYGLNATGWSTQSQFYALLNKSVFLLLITAATWGVIRVAKGGSSQVWLLSIVSLLLAFDLFSANWQTNLYPQLPQWHTQKPAAVIAIQADSANTAAHYRVYNEFQLYDNYGIPFELQDLWGASPLRLARYDAFLAPPMRIERAWELLNVQYVITWRNELYAPSMIIFEEAGIYVHRLDAVAPRAWLVNAVEQLPDAAMIERLTDPAFDPRQTALLSDEIALPPLASSLTGGTATVTAYAPNRIELQVTAAANGLLLLSEIDYPGWQATVDGAPVEILRADYVLRAVPVAAGEHTVVFTFSPLSFRLGAIISALAALLILAGLFLKR